MVASKSQVSLTHEETRQGIPEALCFYGISKATGIQKGWNGLISIRLLLELY